MQFIGLVDFMIVMPLGPELIADLSIDTQRFSWIVSAYTIVAGSFPLLLAARGVTGGFGGLLGGLSLAIVADVFPPDRRGRANGTLMLAFAVASVAGVPLGIALVMNLHEFAPVGGPVLNPPSLEQPATRE